MHGATQTKSNLLPDNAYLSGLLDSIIKQGIDMWMIYQNNDLDNQIVPCMKQINQSQPSFRAFDNNNPPRICVYYLGQEAFI